MAPNTGGPAFPIPNLQHDPDFNGMSLRDYFAASAMSALLVNGDYERHQHAAEACYLIADAMLAARQAPVSQPGIPGELYKLSIDELYELSIDELGLPVRVVNSLRIIEVRTVSELLKYPASELLKLPRLGRESLQAIKDALAVRGLRLKG
ncbi:hypothetical protein JFK97_06620 [Chromobacterium phragmitis]|uniref:DNA-directed RNA polymerase subunit alpha C-terminal domain-containing protein n=1 Tax=Chromobacterium amazonense TaxID=1382803 RepID=UPI0021B82D4B|nr:DNA-directed RNA polymerase subunit alpha C-terminal domain-containing protein [Chromobacterium amazonense]MBM2884060.1 hypothetical protein [Chromobacterium amazonense]